MKGNRSIVIEKGKEEVDRWIFEVRIGTRHYDIEVEKAYVKELAGGTFSARDLVMYSLLFLLEREPPEAILRSFNLKEIKRYFPEYEAAMEFLANR